MQLIPNACATGELPDDCWDTAFQIADCIAGVALTALAPFFPEDDSACTSVVSFPAFGDRPQPDDCCNQVTVLLERIVPIGPKGCWTHWHLPFRLEAVFACYPGISQEVDADVYLPSVTAQEASNRWLYAIGFALADALWGELNDPTCAPLLGKHKVSMGDFLPSGPRGNCAGWHANFTIDLPRVLAAAP